MENNFDWVVASASVIGNGHITEDIPCQDASLVRHEEGYGIAIVCDGAGSCEFSHKGAKQVCYSAYEHFKQLAEEQAWATQQNLPQLTNWKELALETVFKVKTELVDYSDKENIDFKSLSCTFMCTLFFPFGLLMVQIGDGRGGYLSNGEWKSLFKPFQGEFANETVFITSKIWDEPLVDKYISYNVIDSPIEAFCLLSDGCEKASFQINLFDEENEKYFDPNLPYPKFFNPNVDALKKLHNSGKTQIEINELWAEFLINGNPKFKTETDDKTMILGVNLSRTDNENESICTED